MLTIKAIKLKKPAGLDQFEVEDVTLPQVTRGDIRVRLHASSLNVHDYFVVKGVLPTEEGRIPLSDGAGEVVETAGDVTEFSPGDRVISTFFPNWLAGKPTAERVGSISGDTVDGMRGMRWSHPPPPSRERREAIATSKLRRSLVLG